MTGIFCNLFFIVMTISVFLFQARGSHAAVDDIIQSSLYDNDDRARMSAVEKLGTIRDDEAVTLLMSVVADRVENWIITIRAIRLLGEIANPRSTDLLLNVFNDPFLNDECPSIKWNAAVALGNFREDSRVVTALLGAMDYNNLMVREAVIQSLGNIGAPKAVPFLISALADKSFAIRYSAVKALKKIGMAEARPSLKKLAETDDDALIRSEALSALTALH